MIINVKEDRAVAERWVAHWGFSFPVLLDNTGETGAAFAPADLLPELGRAEVVIGSNLIIDHTGKIRFYDLLNTTAFDSKLVRLEARLVELLGEK